MIFALPKSCIILYNPVYPVEKGFIGKPFIITIYNYISLNILLLRMHRRNPILQTLKTRIIFA
jgi:hypothetical protein